MTKLSIASLCWTALAFAALAPAQEAKGTQQAAPPRDRQLSFQQRIYRVKYADTGALARLVIVNSPGTPERPGPYVNFDERMKVISIYGHPYLVSSVLANLQDLDEAAKDRGALSANAEITVWLVAASTSNEEGASPLPSELQPAVKAVSSSFGYKSFQLMDSAVSLIKAGSGFTVRGNAITPNPKLVSKTVAGYTFSCETVRIESASHARTVNLDRFMFRIQVPYCIDADCTKTDRAGIDINGSFSTREGQKVVIGKSKLDGANKDLILIVSAKVVD